MINIIFEFNLHNTKQGNRYKIHFKLLYQNKHH